MEKQILSVWGEVPLGTACRQVKFPVLPKLSYLGHHRAARKDFKFILPTISFAELQMTPFQALSRLHDFPFTQWAGWRITKEQLYHQLYFLARSFRYPQAARWRKIWQLHPLCSAIQPAQITMLYYLGWDQPWLTAVKWRRRYLRRNLLCSFGLEGFLTLRLFFYYYFNVSSQLPIPAFKNILILPLQDTQYHHH